MKNGSVGTSFAEKLLELAIQEGADEAEVYVKASRYMGIEVKELKIDTLERSDSIGYSVRVFRDGRLGFSYSTDPSDIRTVARDAVEASRFTERDEYNSLPAGGPHSPVVVYDEAVDALGEKEAIEMVISMENAAMNEDGRISKTRNASGSFGSAITRIINSQGIDLEFAATSCSAHIMAVAEGNGESQMGWDYQGSRFLRDISFREVGRSAASRALQTLGAKKIASTKGFILLDHSVAADFLGILSSALSAEAVQKNKSMLAGKIGETVISPRIDIIDSALLDGRLGSRPADDEGVATSQKTLIEKGILKGYLYNTYTAKKGHAVSTGNAVRGGFSGLPKVGPTNFFVSASSREYESDFEGLIKRIDKGVYVTETMGMHTANPVSGEYSIGISGLWVENGEIAHPVKETVISGNILQLFKNIVLIGDDLRFYGNIGSSRLLAGDIDISG
ncbi:MAG TPA: TldD/PmbA family protein [Dissulfurispiraceae bacterium]|nr:TldD/PmbA family protein [Dissulfurispiraceae bacterium]